MTKKEIIEAIIETIFEDKTMPFIRSEQLAKIVDFVIKNYNPSLPSNLDEAAEEKDIKREWYNKGYIEGRKNAHIPARELGLPKEYDFKRNHCLTWQDIMNIDELISVIQTDFNLTGKAIYQEVAKKFNLKEK